MAEVLHRVGRESKFSFSTDSKFHILSFFFPEGKVEEPPKPQTPQDEDPSIPGIDEPDKT